MHSLTDLLAQYTRYKNWSLMVYYGRAYPEILPFEGRCDGCSRGPVTERGGNAIGMFKGRWGLDGVFVKANGRCTRWQSLGP